MKQITFIRHGETEYNVLHKFQGIIDVPLNEAGLKQAIAINTRNFDMFDAAYHSGLKRSEQTLQKLVANMNFVKPSKQCDLLRERCYGIFEGLTHSEVLLKHRIIYDSWLIDPSTYIPEAESEEDVLFRVKRFLIFVSKSEDKNIVAVTHSGFMQVLYKFLTKGRGEYLRIDNCESFQLKYTIENDLSLEFQFINKVYTLEGRLTMLD